MNTDPFTRFGWHIARSNADGDLIRISDGETRFYLPRDLYEYLDDEAFLALCEVKRERG